MKEIKFRAGSTVDIAWKTLLKESADCGDTCFGMFNGEEIRSTDTLDEAYVKVTGKAKSEFGKDMEKMQEEYMREKKEHKNNIPNLTKEYREKARGVILEDQYEYWDSIVPIRLNDLYRGMELGATLDICKIMRDESLCYDERLRKAYDEFMKQGHSGMSGSLVAGMIYTFCPDGHDLSDAIRNFRYEKSTN